MKNLRKKNNSISLEQTVQKLEQVVTSALEIRSLRESFEDISHKYTEAQKEGDRHYLMLTASKLENENLKKALEEMSRKYTEAQTKRDGHYLKLIALETRYKNEESRFKDNIEKLQNKILSLQKQVEIYKRDNTKLSSSLSYNLGYALVGNKKIVDYFNMPRNIFTAFRNHKKKKDARASENIIESKPIEPDVKIDAVSPNDQPAVNTNKIDNSGNDGKVKISGSIPRSEVLLRGWSAEKTIPGKPTVLAVVDEFTKECFSRVFNFVLPRPDNCIELLHAIKPDFIFIESSWHGNYSTWKYRIAKYAPPPGNELSLLVNEAKSLGIPTVFWNKEDPVHFARFIDSAKNFDYIFTTAQESISAYKAKNSRALVQVLPFAASEDLHAFDPEIERNGKICFAGSYYATRFEERRNDQLMLLDAASCYDFDIFDRNFAVEADSPFAFPKKYQKFVKGSLSYIEMCRAYKEYSIFLNVNSIVNSETMFSRRIFELLLAGTPVISSPSVGIERFFGNDVVWIVESENEAKYAIDRLLNDKNEWLRRSKKGQELVKNNHTYSHRAKFILNTISNTSESI
ncbi:MAG: glycosyltransferase [Pseudomonadota bacterium]|nr:glycosyltransferase [Pseudomonadota bacterium]